MSGNEDSLGGPPTSSGSSPQLSSLNAQQPSRSGSSSMLLMVQQPNQQPHMMSNDLEALIKTLQDQNQRDDLKLKALNELWDSFDVFTSMSQYSSVMENLVRSFLKLFGETSAQFILENNTQQLRKLMLEIILRTSGHEVMRHFSKQIQMHMMKILQMDNEVNAILATKILIDHLKLHRLPVTPEAPISNIIAHLRKCFNDMQMHVASGRMFEQRPVNSNRPSGIGEDLVIETSLQQCFMQHQVYLDSKNSGMYQLIPRAAQSVKVLGEVVHLIVLFYQLYKQAIINDIIDISNTFCQFINIRVPIEQVKSETRNQELLNEFHNAQCKTLGYFALSMRSAATARLQSPLIETMMANGDRIVSGTLLLLETCPLMVINQRKELLSSTKTFFSFEQLRGKFLPVLPRLFSEKLVIGTAFTANDSLRNMMYTQLADLLHHLRLQLSYPVLCHATYVFSRCLHDPMLPASTQAMSVRLIMNLSDSFTQCEQRNSEPCRDILFGVMDSIITKLRVVVLYHLPLLFQALGEGQVFRSCEFRVTEMHPEEKARLQEVYAHERRTQSQVFPIPPNPSAVNLDDPSMHCSVELVPELEQCPSDKVPPLPPPTLKPPENKSNYSSVEGMLASTWAAQGPPMPLQEARNMVRFLIQACKFLITALQSTKKTDRALTPAEERDVFVRLFKYGIQALDVYLLNPTPGQPRSSAAQQREDKEAIEMFASCFTMMNPDVFSEMWSNHIPFLVERIAIHPNLTTICNSFLVSGQTAARFGSILSGYLLKRMPEMAVTSERATLYLKLFKLIFSAISCAQTNGSTTVEKMIKNYTDDLLQISKPIPDFAVAFSPWLHSIVRDSMYHSLRGREPSNYFLLLRALFRSIGGGSHDVLSVYQEFLPLLPSLLSFLNRMQAGQHRMTMRELFVELCLTVPVRLSSLLPHLPLLMDPLVCSLSGHQYVQQSTTTRGLRTLELCVDNLQPEYLQEHIAPVRAALMQGLWRTVSSNPDTGSSLLALKILGKFGYLNRRMIADAQPLTSIDEADVEPFVVTIPFARSPPPSTVLSKGIKMERGAGNKSGVDVNRVKMETDEVEGGGASSSHQQHPSEGMMEMEDSDTQPMMGTLALSEAVKAAVDNLRVSSQLDERLSNQPPTSFGNEMRVQMRRNGAQLCRAVLLAGLVGVNETPEQKEKALQDIGKKLELITVESVCGRRIYKCTNVPARSLYVQALTGIAISVCGKDLRPTYIKFFSALVRQLTVQALIEQVDPPTNSDVCMDGLVILDVMLATLADPVKHDFIHAAIVMLRLIVDTSTLAVADNITTFCALPLLSHLINEVADLCRNTSCVSKLGGATAIAYIIEEFPRRFIRKHLVRILSALIAVPIGLAYEVSSGAIDTSIAAIERLAIVVFRGREPKPLTSNNGSRRPTMTGASSASQLQQEAEQQPSTPTPSQTNTALFNRRSSRDDDDLYSDEERMGMIRSMSEIYQPLLMSADTHCQKLGVQLLESLSTLTNVPIPDLVSSGPLLALLSVGIRDFPGLSLWRQLGVLNTITFVMTYDIYFTTPEGCDERNTMEIFIRQLVRLCSEDEDKLLSRKTYQLVGAASPTIPHAVCAKFIREAAMSTLTLCYARLPLREKIYELESNQLLVVVLGGLAEKSKGIREVAEESILKANKLRPIPDEHIKFELYRVLNQIEADKGEMTTKSARLMCCLIRLNGTLFDERCYSMLMTVLRSWDDRTRRPSSDLRERTATDIDAMESVLIMLSYIPRKSTPEKMNVDAQSADTATIPASNTVSSSIDPSDFVPLVSSLASTMHAAFCVARGTFFESGALVRFLSMYPIRTLRFFLSADSLSVPARRSLFKRVFECDGATMLRRAAYESPKLLKNMLKLQFLSPSSSASDSWTDAEFNRPLSPYDDKTQDHELLTIWLIDVFSRNDIDLYGATGEPLIRQLQEIWRSDDFKTRYMVKTDEGKDEYAPIRIQFITSPKYEVPKLFASCFVRYLRLNYRDLELFCDLLFVFTNTFVTDFTFVRAYLVNEVIPTYPVAWRRALFEHILGKFEHHQGQTVCNVHIVKVIQYALTPAIQYAFERYDADEVVGPKPESPESEARNLVVRLGNVISNMGKQLSDTMTLAMYHLSSLIVSYAHEHIHVNGSSRQQNNRLRAFMLFAWPCLNANAMDVTLKFMGHLFLAHIIEKFTINRKIVLQVYQSLTTASQQDSRDIVKKALDVLTPMMPVRMDDGSFQLVKAVRKALTDESHNVSIVFHCLQTVTRNYKSYFPIRHELQPLLLSGITRLTSYQAPTGYTDGRRLAVEVCEMILKWEIMRRVKMEDANGSGPLVGQSIERILEALKRAELPLYKEPEKKEGDGSTPAATVDVTSQESSTSLTAPSSSSASSSQTMTGAAGAPGAGAGAGAAGASQEQILRPMSKEHIDQVVNILFKIATTQILAGTPPTHQSAAQELNRRSVNLLRASLRTSMWGEVANIKIAWLEKQLTITHEQLAAIQGGASGLNQLNRLEHSAITSHFFQAANTLEIISQIISVMPKTLVLSTVQPLQKALISCIVVPSTTLTRAATTLVSRLMECTTTSSSGLDEFEVLSQFLAKYINDQLMHYERNSTVPINQTYTALTMLRAICTHVPAYLDTMMLQPLFKALIKSSREFATALNDPSKEKMVAAIMETSQLSLDLIKARVHVLSHDNKRVLSTQILHPLVEATSEKVIESVIRVTREVIVCHADEMSANPGLSIVVKLAAVIRNRFRMKGMVYVELAKFFLQHLVLYVFEHDVLRRTEYAAKLEDVFYWGLTSPVLMIDEATRFAFLAAFEKIVPRALPARLNYIFAQHDWTMMRETFWIRHALFLILRSAFPSNSADSQSTMSFRESATFSATVEYLLSRNGTDGETTTNSDESRFTELLAERRTVLMDATQLDVPNTILDGIFGLVWTINDHTMTSALFVRLFTSLWKALRQSERGQLQLILPHFLSSASHMGQMQSQPATQPLSPLSVILDALSACDPPFAWSPSLVKYVASRHRTYHRGVLLLEEEASRCEVLTNRMKEVEQELLPRFGKQLDVLESLNALYSDLAETDQQVAVWKRRAFIPETVEVVECMQKGEYNQAFELLEDLFIEHGARLERMNLTPAVEGDASLNRAVKIEDDQEMHVAVPVAQYETDACSKMYTECLEQLGRWKELEEYANSSSVADSRILLRTSSHHPEPWLKMRQCREQLTACLPTDYVLQYHTYSTMISVLDSMGDTPAECKSLAERTAEEAYNTALVKWKSLPPIVGASHVKLLQMVHLIQDMNDACSVMCGLHPTQTPFAHQLIVDLKGVVKTWKTSNNNGTYFSAGGSYNSNRNPSLCDDLSTCADFYNVRKRVFMRVSRSFDDWFARGLPHIHQQFGVSHVPLPAHSLIHSQISIARAFRHARLYEAAEHTFNLIHAEPVVPVASMVAKIIEHTKLLRAWAADPRTDEEKRFMLLSRALQMTEDVEMDEVCKEFFARIYAQRGLVQSALHEWEQATQTFEMAAYMQDALGHCFAFAAWAKHLDTVFHAERTAKSAETAGVNAVMCYVECAKVELEFKARRYIAKAVWLVRLIAEINNNEAEALPTKLEMHARSCLTNYWIEWLPQLCLDIRRGIGCLGGFVAATCRMHPLHALYIMRQLTGRPERKHIIEDVTRDPRTNSAADEEKSDPPQSFFIFPRMTNLIGLLSDRRPADVLALERVLVSLEDLTDLWVERHLRYAIALQNEVISALGRGAGNAMVATVRPVAEIVRKWSDALQEQGVLYIREAEVRRSAMEENFVEDEQEFAFTFTRDTLQHLSRETTMTVSEMADLTIEWRTKLDVRLASLPRKIPLEFAAPYLTSFDPLTATIDVPGELITLKNLQYMDVIARFFFHYEVVVIGNQCVKRVRMRSQSGKTVVYLISKQVKAKPMSRVHQLYRELDTILQTDKVASMRFLKIVPPVVVTLNGVEMVQVPDRDGVAFYLDEVLSNHLTAFASTPRAVEGQSLALPRRIDDMVIRAEKRMARHALEGETRQEAAMNVYRMSCDVVPDDLLLKLMQRRVPDPSMYFIMRKSLATEMGVLAALEYALHLSPTAPTSMLIDIGIGRSGNPHYRFDLTAVTTSGAPMDERPVPFRLSPNLQKYFGFSLEGHYKFAMQATFTALYFRPPVLYLRPTIWDAVSEECQANHVTEVNRKTEHAITTVMKRIRNAVDPTTETPEASPLALMQRAMDASNLSRMPTTWHPWL